MHRQNHAIMHSSDIHEDLLIRVISDVLVPSHYTGNEQSNQRRFTAYIDVWR